MSNCDGGVKKRYFQIQRGEGIMKIKRRMKNFIALLVLFTMCFGAIPVYAAVPNLAGNSYMKTYPLSTKNDTYVYTNTSFNTRGTASPYKEYGATIFASDEIRVHEVDLVYRWAYVSYMTSSGQWRSGYIKLSDLTSYNAPQDAMVSNARITAYNRPGGFAYGTIFVGDLVYKLAESGDYSQVAFNISGENYKLAWIKTHDYNKYINVGHEPQGWVDVIEAEGNKLHVRGWCFDRDSLKDGIVLHVYVGGPAGSQEAFAAYAISSDRYRPDVPNVYPGVGDYHGFDETIEIDTNRTGKCGVYIYAINVGGGNNNPLIGSGAVVFGSAEESSNADSWVYPMSNTYVCGNNWRTYYSARSSRPYHVGIDIASSNGDVNVYATADGIVETTGYNSSNGYYVIIKHTIDSKTVYSFYAHLKKGSTVVQKGNSVSAGEKIAVFGNTGSSSAGAHLHFAIVDTLWTGGGYYGYVPYFSGNSTTYQGVKYYNPHYVIEHNKLP